MKMDTITFPENKNKYLVNQMPDGYFFVRGIIYVGDIEALVDTGRRYYMKHIEKDYIIEPATEEDVELAAMNAL